MSEHDITALLAREAETLPPPPDTAVETVLRAGRRRRRVRHGGYAAAAALVLVVAVGIATAGIRSGLDPITPPRITQPFGPAFAAISVCDPEADCQPVAPELLDQVTGIIEDSTIAEVVEIRDGEDVAAAFPFDEDGPPPEGFAQSAASQVVFKISETSEPMPLFRELAELDFTGPVSLGTATVPPRPGPLWDEPPSEHEKITYRTLEAPVAGRDETVSYTTYLDAHGRLCIDEGWGSTGCGWTSIGPGLLSGSVGPYTDAETERHCAQWLTGYNVDRIEIKLADGTTVPNISATARNDLPYPRLAVGCWIGPTEPVTIIAYDANGNDVDRSETIPKAHQKAQHRVDQVRDVYDRHGALNDVPPGPSPTSPGP